MGLIEYPRESKTDWQRIAETIRVDFERQLAAKDKIIDGLMERLKKYEEGQ